MVFKRGLQPISYVFLILATMLLITFFYFTTKGDVESYNVLVNQKNYNNLEYIPCIITNDIYLTDILTKKIPNLHKLDPINLDTSILSCDKLVVTDIDTSKYSLLSQYKGELFLVGNFLLVTNYTLSFLNSTGIISDSKIITLDPSTYNVNIQNYLATQGVVIKEDEDNSIRIISEQDNATISYSLDYEEAVLLEINLIIIQKENIELEIYDNNSKPVRNYTIKESYAHLTPHTYRFYFKDPLTIKKIVLRFPHSGDVVILKGIKLYKGNIAKYKINVGFNEFFPNPFKINSTFEVLDITYPPPIIEVYNAGKKYPLVVMSENVIYLNDWDKTLVDNYPEIRSLIIEFLRKQN